MDEAISQQVNQFLIKPVGPNQIYIACKQILEKNKIIEDRTTSDYLKDFQKINDDKDNIISTDGWWDLYIRLVQWQLKFDEYGDSGLSSILGEQIQSCNKAFSYFIENNYEDLTKKTNNSLLSPGIFQNYLLPLVEDMV